MWWHHFLFIYFCFCFYILTLNLVCFPSSWLKFPVLVLIGKNYKVPFQRTSQSSTQLFSTSFSSAFILGQKRFSYSELVILKPSFWLLELFSALAWKPNLPSLRSRLQPQRVAFCDSFHSAAAATAATRRIDQSQHHQRAHDHHRQPSPLRRAAVPSDFQLRQHEEEIAERFSGKHDGFYQVSTTRLYN